MKKILMQILEALGITFAIATGIAILVCGCLLMEANQALGLLMISVVIFIGIFMAVYFGKN